MATLSYKERQRAARAATRAQREAEKAEWQRRAELHPEVRRLALDAVKATIRDRGDKVQHYTPAQLRAQANAMIGPWLIAKAKERVAARRTWRIEKNWKEPMTWHQGSQYTCATTHPSKWGEDLMSKKAAEHHKKVSEHLTHAARHHGETAKHHEAGSHEKAAHHAHVARGHVIHARGYAEEAVKAHLEEHGKK
jgi:hypothetical protein